LSGFNNIKDPAGTQGYMAAMGMTWATSAFYIGAIVLEVGGGLSVLLGHWTRAGAAALILFMIPMTLIFHTNLGDQNQLIHFLKNLAITGGLLYVVAYGPGPLSVDRRLGKSTAPVGDLGLAPDQEARRPADQRVVVGRRRPHSISARGPALTSAATLHESGGE
jgi:putative oxidoreductase